MKTILLDLDGVLNEYSGEFIVDFIPPAKKEAKSFLQKLSKNYQIVIFTTRNRLLASKWLIENELSEFVFDVSNVKIPAYLCVDDRTVCHQGNFNQTLKQIDNFKVHWQ